MAIVTCDLETFYARDYTLTRMTTAEYNLDPRFQPLMLSLKVDDGPTEVLVGDAAIRSRLVQIDPDKTALLSHYINFDGSILFWHFGFAPKLYLCTLSMARAITHWIIGKSSLAALSTHLGLPPKGDEVVRALGKRLENFTSDELAAYADYCVRDCDNARLAFDKLRPYFSNAELQLIDLIARMFIMPQVKLNAGALAIEFETPPAKFVVSPNSPVSQIWVSAQSKSFKLDWDAARGAYLAHGLQALRLAADGAVEEIVIFLDASLFERFALPAELPAS